MRTITKLVVIGVLVSVMSGCLFTGKTILTGLGIVAAAYKYKSDKKKAKADIKYRNEVKADLGIIKKKLETE